MEHGRGSDGSDEEVPVVYRLAPDCTTDDLEEDAAYIGTVDGIVDYGMFVRLAPGVSGLAHESEYTGAFEVGEEVVVRLLEIRENGDLSFAPVAYEVYRREDVEPDYDITRVEDLAGKVGETVAVEGRLVQVNQTGGPTLFHVSDGTGVVPCASFEAAGVRAFPEIQRGAFVRVVGAAGEYEDGVQLEADYINPLEGDAVEPVRSAYETAITRRSETPDIDALVEWEALEKLRPAIRGVAERLRRAVLENKPVVLRHHADADGLCASLPVEVALERFITVSHQDPNAARHLVHRMPSRAPYYELEDVTRDLSHALAGRDRHGQGLPVVVMIDNGCTTDDIPAYNQLASYDIPVIVIDHHHPDEEVTAVIDEHINPYEVDEDYRVTAGMMCVELARYLDPGLSDDIRHVPGVAGLADRSEASVMEDYLELAADAGYAMDELSLIGRALDYAAYLLRYDHGRGLMNDILGVGGSPDRHGRVPGLLADHAERSIERQLEVVLPHVTSRRLGNDIALYQLDVEGYARRFEYPPPGTTTSAVHDRMAGDTEDPVITIGYGPDFAVLRSDRVLLDIPRLVTELNTEVPGAGVNGGGHLVVGSIRFVRGMREPVIEALVEKLAEAEIDETVGTTAPWSQSLSDAFPG